MPVQLFRECLYFEPELLGVLWHRHIHMCGRQRGWVRRVLSHPDCPRSVHRDQAVPSLLPLPCNFAPALGGFLYFVFVCGLSSLFIQVAKALLTRISFFSWSPPPLGCLEPPSFEQTPDSVEVLPGMSLTFTSVIRGTPPFKVKWFKGSRELVSGESCSISLEDFVTELELFEVEPLQSGDYSCLVTNDAGSASCTTHLFVKGLLFYPNQVSLKFSFSFFLWRCQFCPHVFS